MLKLLLATAATVAALVMPLSANAQWTGGDYYRGRSTGYNNFSRDAPFRGPKAHIRAEIRDGLNDGWLDGEAPRRVLSGKL